jgi:PTH1 family peptidyl-tRNA hydrolase
MENTQEKVLIVGLGNPGKEYKMNRHNTGFMLIDAIAKEAGIRVGRAKSRSLAGEGTLYGAPAVLAKPHTYMNESGNAVASLLKVYRIDLGHLLVAHDDLDLPFGTIRMRAGGGSAGHKGVESISRSLGTGDYVRLRIGIGRPPGNMDAADYVLEDFDRQQEEELPFVMDLAVKAVKTWITEGLAQAMNVYNNARISNNLYESYRKDREAS